MQKLNQSDIENINVLKGDYGTKRVGDDAKNGVVLISTSAAAPSIVIDGKKATKADLKNLDPSDIKTVEVVKDAAKKSPADSSVISITTKKKQ